jgi:hypothetical protein
MISRPPLQPDRPSVLSRGAQILLRYLLALVVIPQLVLGLGLLIVRHAEWVYSVITLPLVLYCAPVVALFGNAHFITHATLCPADLAGWASVVAFYTGLALVVSMFHILITRRKGNAEPGAPPNSRPPSQSPTSPETQTPDSLRTPSTGGCW